MAWFVVNVSQGLLPVLVDPHAGPLLAPLLASGQCVHPCSLPWLAAALPRTNERTPP